MPIKATIIIVIDNAPVTQSNKLLSKWYKKVTTNFRSNNVSRKTIKITVMPKSTRRFTCTSTVASSCVANSTICQFAKSDTVALILTIKNWKNWRGGGGFMTNIVDKELEKLEGGTDLCTSVPNLQFWRGPFLLVPPPPISLPLNDVPV